ncbi:MAG: polyketide synthase dehydratase domain-containing protein, partial [Stellaceae bacterium]
VPRGRRVALQATPFDRSPYWLGEATRTAAPRFSFLGEPRRSARSGEEIRNGRLDPEMPWLHDHVVDGTMLLPAAGFLSMALAQGFGALSEIEYRRPLEIAADGVAIQLVRDRGNSLELYADTAAGWTEIASARIAPVTTIAPFAELPSRSAELVDGADFAAELEARGFELGPAYRVLRRLARGGATAAAEIIAPLADTNAGFGPLLLDAAFQTLTALLPPTGMPWLPARIARVVAGAEPRGSLHARARLRQCGEQRAIGDAVLERADGSLVALLEGVELRPMTAGPGAWFHDVVWRPAPAPGCLPGGDWHAIGPGAAALGVASCDETGEAPLPAATQGIVDLRPLAAATPEACTAATAVLVRRAAAMVPPPQLVLLSRGASLAPPVLAGAVPAAAVLMGMQPAIAAEHPELRCRWLDLDPDDPAIPAAMAGAAGRYALRQGQLSAPEIVKSVEPPPGVVRLTPGPEHSFADLAIMPDEDVPPGPGEVRIAVAAAGLNFKDVLSVLGRAPGPEQRLGLECAGQVVAVGAGVAEFAPGDRVVAFAPGALASRVNVAARQVLRRPDWLDVDATASLPVAALTAWHGLCDLAAVGPGMRVLVHAGAGGVGSMAVGLARVFGARVFATTSAGKEHAARAAGAEAVGDSRSTAFAAAARDWAGAEGFDIVLNALGPEIAAASAALLRPGGVFLEIGNAPPPATAQPIRHVAYDLTMPMAADPLWLTDRMNRILELIKDERLSPPRRTVLPLTQAENGLRALGQGATIGKLVLRFPQPLRLRRDGTYLITGGTGAVGRTLARWLAAAGAGRVVLAAR